MNFQDKAVLVTGAGAGIGQAAALAFAQAGAVVGVNSLNYNKTMNTIRIIQEAGGKAIPLDGDVSCEETAQKLVQKFVEQYGRLDVLINNAGIVLGGNVEETSAEDWDLSMKVNTRSVFLMCKYAVGQMKNQGDGVIVNNASAVVLRGVANRAAYSASKGAIVALTKAMAQDYLKDNIRVNCVCPGTVHTPSLEQRISNSSNPEQAMKDFVARQAIGRLGKPDEIAAAILFAASPENSFMTGAVIAVDGGMSI